MKELSSTIPTATAIFLKNLEIVHLKNNSGLNKVEVLDNPYIQQKNYSLLKKALLNFVIRNTNLLGMKKGQVVGPHAYFSFNMELQLLLQYHLPLMFQNRPRTT